MITRRLMLSGTALGLVAAAFAPGLFTRRAVAAAGFPITHTDAEWHTLLKAEQYDILRQSGTEAPFSSPLLHEERHGVFTCAGCSHDLFASATKFDSGTGWPSFWQPLAQEVATSADGSLGMDRTEVHCAHCGGHLGHVFDDGPRPTGLRYCMNGAAMGFRATSA